MFTQIPKKGTSEYFTLSFSCKKITDKQRERGWKKKERLFLTIFSANIKPQEPFKVDGD